MACGHLVPLGLAESIKAPHTLLHLAGLTLLSEFPFRCQRGIVYAVHFTLFEEAVEQSPVLE